MKIHKIQEALMAAIAAQGTEDAIKHIERAMDIAEMVDIELGAIYRLIDKNYPYADHLSDHLCKRIQSTRNKIV